MKCRCDKGCPKGCGCSCHMVKEHETKLGAMLALYRHARGVDLRTIATEIGVSAATMSRIENGKSPDLRTFSKMLVWMES